MKKKLRILLISILIIGVAMGSGMYLTKEISIHRAKKLFNQVRNHDKLYVYETYFGALNAAFYVKNLKDTSALIDYYFKLARHDTTAVINFELNFMTLTLHEPIYVYNYLNKGSNIIQVIDFDKGCWGYLTGYVYKPTTHRIAPPDSLVKEKEAFIATQSTTKYVKTMDRIAKKINPYGWYCDN